MTIIEAINQINHLKPNNYTQQEKIFWLSELDGAVKAEILDATEEGRGIAFSGYDDNSSLHTSLLIPPPYDEIYLFWLASRIDFWNSEYDLYNNSILMFNTAFKAYHDHYNSRNRPARAGGFHL